MASTIPAPQASPQASFNADKIPLCINFILNLLRENPPRPPRPLIIGLNGPQGIGKTTLVTSLAATLSAPAPGPALPTLVLSIDDFYLTHTEQNALASSHPDNALVQHRGQPGTHDLQLAREVLESLCRGAPTRVPSYDKAAFSGRGDRTPEATWLSVNDPGDPPVRVVILEGWCLGFRALPPSSVAQRRAAPNLTLGRHALDDLLYVNEQLRAYDGLTGLFDGFVHLDAEDLSFVYAWRREQEAALRSLRGEGMTDEQVDRFVDAYFPGYELYYEGVRAGVFPGKPGRQLRLLLGRDRKVKESSVI